MPSKPSCERRAAAAPIISASVRSDIPAHHAAWFRAAYARGWTDVANPMNARQIRRVELRAAAVAGFVFWTRNPLPFMAVLERLAEDGVPFTLNQTITGLPRALEPHVLRPEAATRAARQIAARFGARRLVWRFDPVVLTPTLDEAATLARFGALAAALEGATDEVAVSFVQPYAKAARRWAALATAAPDLARHEPTPEEQARLALALGAHAAEHGMRLTLCTQPGLSAATGLPAARCIDAARLASGPASTPARPMRPGCLCAPAIDIGAYDSCAQGCVYCYAVRDFAAAARRLHVAPIKAAPALTGLARS